MTDILVVDLSLLLQNKKSQNSCLKIALSIAQTTQFHRQNSLYIFSMY